MIRPTSLKPRPSIPGTLVELTPSDQALIDGANRGEAEAFEELYRRYRDWVVAVAYRYTGDRDDALDVLQDTFAYLFGKFPGFTLTARLTTFLYPVVKNLCVDRLRKRRPTVDMDSLADMLAAHRDANRRRRSATSPAVPPRQQREVLLLRFVDDFSLQQIAERSTSRSAR